MHALCRLEILPHYRLIYEAYIKGPAWSISLLYDKYYLWLNSLCLDENYQSRLAMTSCRSRVDWCGLVWSLARFLYDDQNDDMLHDHTIMTVY